MPAIHIQPFMGTVPKLASNALPDGAAQVADSVKLYSGELRSWRKPLLVINNKIVAGALSLYRLYGAGGSSKMLSWAADVDVVAGALSDSADYRIYYTGDATPRKTNWALAISGTEAYPADYLEMGVPAPATAPTLTPTNGTGTVETRVYVMTNVSTFGSLTEESAPSPVATTSLNPTGGSVLLNAFPALPAGKYNITHRRIYRTLVGTNNYGLVAQITAGTTSYNDTAEIGSATTILQSTFYTPPPADLKGIVSMPNGMLAGFKDNEVWFCEPYKHHAWPVTYMQTVDAPVVGLGVFGSSLVVMTQKSPYIMYGSHPSAMSQDLIPIAEPCISKRSISHDELGVLYVSPNGVVGIGVTQRGLITEQAYMRDEWQALSPESMFGKLYGRNYIMFHADEAAPTRSATVIPRDQGTVGITKLYAPASAFYVDRVTGNTFMASEVDGLLYQLDADELNYSGFEWKSKRYTIPQMINFTCFQLDADYAYLGQQDGLIASYAEDVAQNNALYATGAAIGQFNAWQWNGMSMNASPLIELPVSTDLRTINVTIFADGVQVASSSVYSRAPLRIGDGFKAYDWEVRVSGNVPIRSFAMATSIAELKQVS